jgi:tryptophan 2,3-dioxygenase
MSTKPYYHSYLQLDQILDSQAPISFQEGNQPAHDEMLFIIIHQAYELWFKQIIFELDYVLAVFDKPSIDDNSDELNLVRHRLERVIKVWQLLNQQIHMLDTMTPLDFLAFRNLLTPSSGFQSVQFRLIEAKLGLRLPQRHQADYYKRTNEGGLSQTDYNALNATEADQNLLQLINNWLERIPFFENSFWQSYKAKHAIEEGHPFWNDYDQILQTSMTEQEKDKLILFRHLFFKEDEAMKEIAQQWEGALSRKARQAALFIMLYRDFPVFQTAYQILDNLIEIDHLMSTWRYNHFVVVRRMIGQRVGTGNTSGGQYLEAAISKHYIFKELSQLSTFLINRQQLPKLPNELIQHLGYAISTIK